MRVVFSINEMLVPPVHRYPDTFGLQYFFGRCGSGSPMAGQAFLHVFRNMGLVKSGQSFADRF